MRDIAIQVDNLSKRYRIGKSQDGRSTYGSLRETLADAASAPLRRLRRSGNGGSQSEQNFIWALKDVSFEVKKGEVVGIIGRNGAGKTTLLKVLSRITRPTQGKVRLWGRVGSLLEVGTGFHPELTGRENIYLNGAVLGMQRVEIERKFDEIVDFAEIEQFLDTPVKRYSSGMYMRLAFAVAAHLEPEILLVDEVLAVGDAAFQKKCLGKMGKVAQEGRTVLFVSHNMGAISSLTKSCIYLDKGDIKSYSITDEVLKMYSNDTLLKVKSYSSINKVIDIFRRPGSKDDSVRIIGISTWDKYFSDNSPKTVQIGEPFTIFIKLEIHRKIAGANITIKIKNNKGDVIAIYFSWDQEFQLYLDRGTYIIKGKINIDLSPGSYYIDIGINKSSSTLAFDVILDFPIVNVVNINQIIHWKDRPWGNIHGSSIDWKLIDKESK